MEFGEIVDEAAERAGLDPAALTHRHLNSITRSLTFIQNDLETDGASAEFRMETSKFTLELGQGAIVLPADTIDVTEVSVAYPSGGSSNDLPISRIVRDDYLRIPNKETTGRPTMFWVSKSLSTAYDDLRPYTGVLGSSTGLWAGTASQSATGLVLILYPITDQGSVVVKVNRMRRMSTNPGLLEDVDARENWLDLIAEGLASRIAQKYNYQRYGDLLAKYEGMKAKRTQNEDHGPVTIGFRGYGFSRRRRH